MVPGPRSRQEADHPSPKGPRSGDLGGEAYIQGISTRSVDELVKALGMAGISKSQVSRLCEEIDERVNAFLSRPIEGSWPYLWIDATYLKVRQGGRTVSVALAIVLAPMAHMARSSERAPDDVRVRR